jgi:hypothetical protein
MFANQFYSVTVLRSNRIEINDMFAEPCPVLCEQFFHRGNQFVMCFHMLLDVPVLQFFLAGIILLTYCRYAAREKYSLEVLTSTTNCLSYRSWAVHFMISLLSASFIGSV